MKKNILLLAFISLAAIGHSQSHQLDTRKYIEVTGSADMIVAPDEIELEVILQEFIKSGTKVKLNEVNDIFYKILVKNKLDTGKLAFQNISDDYWWYWWRYRESYYQTKTITLKLSKATNILQLVQDLNEKWVQSIRISKSTHTKIHQYRRQVKAEAAKMAKEKAAYLLESLGEELGTVLSAEEMPEQNHNYWWYNSSNLLGNSTIDNGRVGSPDNENNINNVASIKLRYEMKVKFSIK